MKLFWNAFLLSFGSVFTVAEIYAIMTKQQTLTSWVRDLTVDWPWVPYGFGILAIALAVHFWWELR